MVTGRRDHYIPHDVMMIGTRFRPLHFALLTSVGTGVAGQAALVVSGILVARMLGVENRGHLALLTILPLLISQIGGLGVWLSVTFFVAQQPANTRGILRRLARFLALQALLLTSVHGLALMLVFGDESRDAQLAAAFTLPVIPASLAQLYGLAILQGQQRFRAFNLCRFAPGALYALSALVLFLANVRTLPMVTACYVGALLMGATAFVIAWRGVDPQPVGGDSPTVREMIRFGTRAILGSASPTDGLGIDQAIVGLFLSSSALGLYVVGLAFTNLPRFVAQSIGMVAYPNVAAREAPHDARRALWKFSAVGVGVCLAIVMALEIGAGWLIPFFFGPSFSGSVEITRLLLISAFFLSVRRVLSDAARGAGEPMLGTIAEIASLATMFPAMAVFAPALGVDGVAAALGAGSSAGLLAILVGLVRSRRRIADSPLRRSIG